MKFIVTIAAYNVERTIGETIESLLKQTCREWICLITDDMSTDGTAAAAQLAAGNDPRITVIRNTEKKFLLRNMAESIEAAGPDGEDVIVPLDGDDRLAGPDALKRLELAYRNECALMTYGSYIGTDNRAGKECTPYPYLVRKFKLYRWARWRATHLKSFKVWLWKKINSADLTITEEQMREFCSHRRKSGLFRSAKQFARVEINALVEPSHRFFRRCVDKVIMFPMLEMAGSRAVFIPDILYVYNRHGSGYAKPGAMEGIPRHANRFIRSYLRGRARYPSLRTLRG